MFLKIESIPELIYPGSVGEHVRKINLGRRFNNLHLVLSGSEISSTHQATCISNKLMNLQVMYLNNPQNLKICETF